MKAALGPLAWGLVHGCIQKASSTFAWLQPNAIYKWCTRLQLKPNHGAGFHGDTYAGASAKDLD
jgi:hypothetical protein